MNIATNIATTVTNADYLPDQRPLGACQVVRFPTRGAVSIYCDGVLHMGMNGSMADARNRISGLYNAYPGHHWSFDDE